MIGEHQQFQRHLWLIEIRVLVRSRVDRFPEAQRSKPVDRLTLDLAEQNPDWPISPKVAIRGRG